MSQSSRKGFILKGVMVSIVSLASGIASAGSPIQSGAINQTHMTNEALFKKVQSRTDTRDQISERVKKIIAEHFRVELEKVTENASYTDDLGADSLDSVELVIAFEEEFNVAIPDDAAEKIKTVRQAIDFIMARPAGAAY